MRKICGFAILMLAIAIPAFAQSQLVAVPSASTVTPPSVALTWLAGTPTGTQTACSSAFQCDYVIYRIDGACPATITGTTAWTKVLTTGPNALAATDATVAPGKQYSYVAEALSVSDGTNSDPSNCTTVTTKANPRIPAPPANVAGS